MGERQTKQQRQQVEQTTPPTFRPLTKWPWDVRENRLSPLTQITQALAVVSSRNSALEKILEATLTLLKARRGSILLSDPMTKDLTIKVAKGIPPSAIQQVCLKMGEGISGFVAQKGRPLLVDDVQTYRNFRRTPASRYESEVFFSIPIVSAPLNIFGETLGVMNISDAQYGTSFTTEELALLSILALEAALVVAYWQIRPENSFTQVTTEVLGVLTSISGHAQYLIHNIPEECKAAEVLKKIVDQSKQAGLVIKQIQGISK